MPSEEPFRGPAQSPTASTASGGICSLSAPLRLSAKQLRDHSGKRVGQVLASGVFESPEQPADLRHAGYWPPTTGSLELVAPDMSDLHQSLDIQASDRLDFDRPDALRPLLPRHIHLLSAPAEQVTLASRPFDLDPGRHCAQEGGNSPSALDRKLSDPPRQIPGPLLRPILEPPERDTQVYGFPARGGGRLH